MSNPNPERDERPKRVWITWDDAYPWPTAEMGGDEYVRAEVVNKLALAMRDRCVQKVKLLAQSWEHAATQWHEKAQAESRPDFKRINYEERDACLQKRDAANVIANNLQVLTLEGEQEK